MNVLQALNDYLRLPRTSLVERDGKSTVMETCANCNARRIRWGKGDVLRLAGRHPCGCSLAKGARK